MSSRNSFRGFSYWNADASVFRTVSVTERYKLQFRMDVFNVFNHANLNNPAATVPAAGTVSNFASITSAQTTRRLQLGLRLTF